jgi:hypothetical protein
VADLGEPDDAIVRAPPPSGLARGRAGRPGRLLRRFAEAVDADVDHLAQLEVANPAPARTTRGGRRATSADVLHLLLGRPGAG